MRILSLHSCIILIALLSLSLSLTGQVPPDAPEPVGDLNNQFNALKEGSESFKEYKVIKNTKLSNLWKNVQDSVIKQKQQIITSNQKIEEQKTEIGMLKKNISDLENKLAESEELRKSIPFLGAQIYKTTYNWIVWLIIAGLAVFGILSFNNYIRSKKVTDYTKREFRELEGEYQDYKKRSQEKQIKIGRELQTERNLVEELKVKLSKKIVK